MAWFRFDDRAIDHPKFLSLSDGAFRLWVEGGAFCNRHLTDGLILRAALNGFRYVTRKRVDELVAVRLWDVCDEGFRLHDYHQWNDSKDEVVNKKRLALHRKAFLEDKGLRQRLRDRDGDLCRYCGCEVNWADRRGATGATYDHVNPTGDATMENLVIACRGCNSSKRNRTPEQAGMILLPTPYLARDLDPISDRTTGSTSGVGITSVLSLKEEKVFARFEDFWEAYPRRVGKAPAEREWRKLKPDAALFDLILAAIERQARTPQWTKDGGQFIPHAATWLNQRRWEDDIAPAKPTFVEPVNTPGECPHSPRCAAPGRWDCMRRSQLEQFKREAS